MRDILNRSGLEKLAEDLFLKGFELDYVQKFTGLPETELLKIKNSVSRF